MDKVGRLIIILLLIAVLILGGFTCWKMTENQKEVNEKIEKIEKVLETGEDEEDIEENTTDNLESNTEVKAFSKEDLKVDDSFSLGESAKAVESKYGDKITSTTTTEEGATGRILNIIICESLGLRVENDISQKGSDGKMVRIKLYNNSKLKTARGIKIGDSKEAVLTAYKSDSILAKEDGKITVGFPGDDPIYEMGKGKIYFTIVNGKVSEILVAYGVAE